METVRLILMYAAMITALGWIAIFFCVLFNRLRGRSNPDFLENTKGKYHLPGKPALWRLRLILLPIGSVLILLLAWIWLLFVVPLLVIKQSQRLKTLIWQ